MSNDWNSGKTAKAPPLVRPAHRVDVSLPNSDGKGGSRVLGKQFDQIGSSRNVGGRRIVRSDNKHAYLPLENLNPIYLEEPISPSKARVANQLKVSVRPQPDCAVMEVDKGVGNGPGSVNIYGPPETSGVQAEVRRSIGPKAGKWKRWARIRVRNTDGLVEEIQLGKRNHELYEGGRDKKQKST
ncbi:hypothetical protein LWI29_001441 [Acer saccharum]|uniref:Uncharacterized protein n=1 Tax=Acer saccharum TaxID=4024 RepID=A0AA39RI30_ACESA|nr:hypothetical protein LWI29_001441 [Acer saccharum]